MGGLGNQLFEYSFGYRLSIESGHSSVYDYSNGFKNDKYGRKYALSKFAFEISPCSVDDIPIGMAWTSPMSFVAKLYWSHFATRKKVIFEKQYYNYDQKVLDYSDNGNYYFGYWQNPKYFTPVENDIRTQFKLKVTPKDSFYSLQREMLQTNSISIHIRRYSDKDKAGNLIKSARKIHGVCPLEYYSYALQRIPEPRSVCYVFTDDLEWCKNNIYLPRAYRYVAEYDKFSDAEEIFLMSTCKHHIISNSSFGWWGAWLGDAPEKIVVAPKQWVSDGDAIISDLFPETWQII